MSSFQKWTGKEIYEAHVGGGGSHTWKELRHITGLSIGQLRGRAKRYQRSIEHNTTQGRRTDKDDVNSFEQVGKNEARGEATFSFPATLDDLMTELKVDLDVWEVERWGYSTKQSDWEGYAKIGSTKTINYENGKQVGYETDEKLDTIPLHGESCKIWATFKRKEPIEVFPAVKPVIAAHKFEKPKPPNKKGIITELLFSDSQVGFHRSTRTARLKPFHCRATLDAVFQIAVYINADIVRELGDGLDLPEWSDKFLKDPHFYWSTQPSLEEKHWQLARFRHALPKARIIYHQGNHDKRMPAAIMTHLPAAYGLHQAGHGGNVKWPVLSVPYLLDLDGLGIEYIGDYPSDVDILNAGCCVYHGDKVRKQSNDTSKAIARDAVMVEIFGHTHRLDMASYTHWPAAGPEFVRAYNIGCTCRIDGTVPGSKRGSQWQNGCAVARYDPQGDMVDVQLIPIDDGCALYDGKLFEGRDYVDQLQRDLPGWNWSG